jgi:hypothetical protein
VNPSVVARLVELAEAATPGPWMRIGSEVSRPEVDIVRWSYEDLPPSQWPDAEARYAPNLDFIVAARDVVVPLAEDWKRMVAALQEIVDDFEAVELKRGEKADPRDYVSERLAGYAIDALAALDLKEEPAK